MDITHIYVEINSRKYNGTLVDEGNKGLRPNGKKKNETRYKSLSLYGGLGASLNNRFTKAMEESVYPSFDHGPSNGSNESIDEIHFQDLRAPYPDTIFPS